MAARRGGRFRLAAALGVAAWVWAGATAAQTAPAAAPATWAGPAHCRAVVPAGWPASDLRWSGDCRDGLAQGRGVLRVYAGGQLRGSYFGRVAAGQPQLGVIERPDGFVAGRFEAGRVLQDGDRNILIEAFDEASAAARQLAGVYRQAGNGASSRYYENKAEQLARQLD
jgi:hypothetical protein